jgi:hypothetical protein
VLATIHRYISIISLNIIYFYLSIKSGKIRSELIIHQEKAVMTQKPMIFALIVATLCQFGGLLVFSYGLLDAGLMVTGMALMTLTLFSRRNLSRAQASKLSQERAPKRAVER